MVWYLQQGRKRFQLPVIEFRKMQRGEGAKDRIGFLEAAMRGAEKKLLATNLGWALFHRRRYSLRRPLLPALSQ